MMKYTPRVLSTSQPVTSANTAHTAIAAGSVMKIDIGSYCGCTSASV